jgi:tetratricopeptide (TPR) repeat protein
MSLKSRVARVRVRFARALGEHERDRGRYDRAEQVLRDAVVRAERLFGECHPDTIAARNALGMVHKYRGQFREGRSCYWRALRAERARPGSNNLVIATLYHNIGGIEHSARRFRRAEPFARASVRLREQVLGSAHPDVAADKAALAAIIEGLGRQEEAERLYREALGVLEARLGPRHIDTAAALNNLATCCASLGRLAEARLHGERALAMKESLLGKAHPDVAITLSNLAVIYWRLGRVLDAEQAHAHAIAILQDCFGPSHPRTVRCRSAMRALRG